MITVDATTGSQMAVLTGHTNSVTCITFASDGRSLASGSLDKTVKLWDIQAGGVIKTFHDHSHYVDSVSISRDYTRIASGFRDGIICVWDIQTGEHLHIVKQWSSVHDVHFTPTDPQLIISISDSKVWKCDLNSQQTSSLYDATSLAFSLDHTQLALCHEKVITVWNFNSGEIIAQSNVAEQETKHCCFSPDGTLIAAAIGSIACVWDIAGPDCCLVETFVGHTKDINALVFSSPSSLLSISQDESLKFWQIGASPKNQTATGLESFPPAWCQTQSVSLQARAGIAISSDEAGVVKTWDLLTGLYKTSIETPIGDQCWRDVQLIGNRLVIAWCDDDKIHIWDTNKNKDLWTVDRPPHIFRGLRISGDGTMVFCLTKTSIQAWSIDTGEHMGKIELELERYWYLDPLQMDGSRVWIRFEDLSTQGWDFGTLSSSFVPLSIGSTERPPLDFIGGAYRQTDGPSRIVLSGKEVFQLSGKHATPGEVRWDGQYLIAIYSSGELLILDFHNMYPQ